MDSRIVRGYKATDKDMKCLGVQFVLGEWQEIEGELIECENGFHFCTELAHTYIFYPSKSARRFICEAQDLLRLPTKSGVITKRVARRIRLVEEITVSDSTTNNIERYNTGNFNTGSYNTGSYNTGYYNTGNYNTGDFNTGDLNSGNLNSGNCNTGSNNNGYRNTGDYNTGDMNVGDENIGSYNTGDRNVGDFNVGSNNLGDFNVGDWNICNYSNGFFNSQEPRVTSFDVECEYTKEEYLQKFHYLCADLYQQLKESSEEIDITPFLKIPNITQEKVNLLQKKMREI
ncbi:MAG: pentapeptide repeat-containing protein [Waterburya sp.]